MGLGLAALGRPGYINLGHSRDLAGDYQVAAMRNHAHAVLDAETRFRTIRLFADPEGRARLSDGVLSYERTDDQEHAHA